MLNKLDINNKKLIYYLGRNLIEKDKVTFFNTCSGFAIDFIGSRLTAKFDKKSIGLKLRIFIDDDKEGKIVFVTEDTLLVNNLPNEKHSIKVFKCNSEEWGVLTLLEISGADSYLEYENKYDYKFEFLGDSITAGYGINSLPDCDSIENEDGTLTYAKRVCDYFNAEPCMLAQSGVSLAIPVYHDWIMYDRYDLYSVINYQHKWDFRNYQPDVMFINLGTNDSALVNEDNKIIFKDKYLKLLKDLRKLYPETIIIQIYGMIGNNSFIKTAIENAKNKANDSKVFFKEFYCPNVRQGFNGHPSIEDAKSDSLELIEFVKTILK